MGCVSSAPCSLSAAGAGPAADPAGNTRGARTENLVFCTLLTACVCGGVLHDVAAARNGRRIPVGRPRLHTPRRALHDIISDGITSATVPFYNVVRVVSWGASHGGTGVGRHGGAAASVCDHQLDRQFGTDGCRRCTVGWADIAAASPVSGRCYHAEVRKAIYSCCNHLMSNPEPLQHLSPAKHICVFGTSCSPQPLSQAPCHPQRPPASTPRR